MDDIVMPEQVSLGFSGGPRDAVSVISLKGGKERRQLISGVMVRHYSFSYDNQPDSVVIAARNFYFDRRGRFKAFLFKDWMNYSVSGGALGTGDGSTVTFQCVQIEGTTTNPYSRIIRHLKSGTLKVYVAGVLKTVVTDYTVSASGLITFVSAPADMAAITADFEFYVPVRFDSDSFSEKLPYRTPTTRSVDSLALIEIIE